MVICESRNDDTCLSGEDEINSLLLVPNLVLAELSGESRGAQGARAPLISFKKMHARLRYSNRAVNHESL